MKFRRFCGKITVTSGRTKNAERASASALRFLRLGRNSFQRFRFSVQNPLIQKACQEPYRRIVQPDHALNIPARPAVVPGTHAALLQQAAGYIFCEKDSSRVDGSAHPEAFFPEQSGDRRQKGCHPVNGKHPDGGMAFQLHLPPLKRFEAGPEDFQTPACKTAYNKSVFHHTESMRGKGRTYA